jgi:hypothetical protein
VLFNLSYLQTPNYEVDVLKDAIKYVF